MTFAALIPENKRDGMAMSFLKTQQGEYLQVCRRGKEIKLCALDRQDRGRNCTIQITVLKKKHMEHSMKNTDHK